MLEVEVGAASAGAGRSRRGTQARSGWVAGSGRLGGRGLGAPHRGGGLTMRIEEAARSGSQERNIVEL